jgi:hypothetical protein
MTSQKKGGPGFLSLNFRDIRCICVCCKEALPLEQINDKVEEEEEDCTDYNNAPVTRPPPPPKKHPRLLFGCFKLSHHEEDN